MKKHSALSILFAVVSLLTLSAHGGDWKSAGLPMKPYEPSYEYRYACELELQQSGLSQTRGLVSVGILHFELNNQEQELSRWEQHSWRHEVRDYRDLTEKTVNEPLPFSTAGHSLFLRWQRAPHGDQLTISVWLRQSLGEFTATFENEGTYPRESKRFAVNVRTGSARKDGERQENLSGKLSCEKLR